MPHLLGLASEMEAQRDHILGAPKDPDGLDDALLERAQRAEDAEGELEKRFEALSATAELDQVIFDGASFGTGARTGTPEEEEYLGPARPAHPRPGGGAAQPAPVRAAGGAEEAGQGDRCRPSASRWC